ncbi:hypothetical protein Q9966_006764, partial [Columba livia]
MQKCVPHTLNERKSENGLSMLLIRFVPSIFYLQKPRFYLRTDRKKYQVVSNYEQFEGLAAHEQDPAVFGAEFAKISRATLRIRYSLLPYLYTLFYESHVHGNTVARSLMHEFTSDQETHGIDTAFLWGPAFMIAPVLQEASTGARSVDVYFPEATWFDYYTGHKVPSTWKKNYATVAAPLNKIPLFIRGGYILPEQAPASTTTKRKWESYTSVGQDTIENENYFLAKYTYSKGNLKTEILKNGYRGADTLKYNKITILGLKQRPHAVTLNGRTIRGNAFSYELSRQFRAFLLQGLFATQVVYVSRTKEKKHLVYNEHEVENRTTLQQSCCLAGGAVTPFPALALALLGLQTTLGCWYNPE